MGILEQVNEMKKKGNSDEEIITTLRQKGYSPKEVKDALDQSQIKEAIYDVNPNPNNPQANKTSQQQAPQQYPSQGYAQPYTYEQGGTPTGGHYAPQTREFSEYPEEFYSPEEQDYNYEEGIGTETVIEIAEQVFSEKTKKLQKKINELNEYKTLSQAKIENLSERIKRIEAVIDKLQTAILEKIGSYGGTLEGIKKEMSMMQDTFGKILPHLVKKKTGKGTKKTKTKKA